MWEKYKKLYPCLFEAQKEKYGITARVLYLRGKYNKGIKWHGYCYTFSKSDNSYLLSPEKGRLCPPKQAFFHFGPLLDFP